MKWIVVLLVLAAGIAPAYAETQDTQDLAIRPGELLTLERSIALALKVNPGIRSAQGAVAVSEARKGQAQAGYYPQVDATAGYARIQPGGIQTGSGTIGGSGRGTSHSFEQYSTGVTARQTIFDFGKTGTQVDIQKRNIEASRSDLGSTEDQIILNVKQAYYELVRAKRNLVVAHDTVRQFQQHLEQAKAFFEVGTRPKFDVTKAEVDLSSAKLGLINAENAVRLGVASLNNAMGIPDAPEYRIDDSLRFEKSPIGFDDAIKKAYENKPELKAIASRRTAAELSIALAKKGYYPVFTGNASWQWSGERFAIGDSWSAGVGMSFPIFSGFSTKYEVDEARANLNILTANELSLKQSVRLEVQQAYLNMIEAEERISVAEITVRQATENHEIASGRYAAGVGSPIEVTDAEVALASAKLVHIRALFDYRISVASLEKAMGSR